jgi:hypothetical protein
LADNCLVIAATANNHMVVLVGLAGTCWVIAATAYNHMAV